MSFTFFHLHLHNNSLTSFFNWKMTFEVIAEFFLERLDLFILCARWFRRKKEECGLAVFLPRETIQSHYCPAKPATVSMQTETFACNGFSKLLWLLQTFIQRFYADSFPVKKYSALSEKTRFP